MSKPPPPSPLAPSVWPRLKRAVIAAIDLAGNISGAQATCGRGSVVGDWHNRTLASFPPIDCALAMDEVAVIRGERPEILHRYAAELGHAAIQLPEVAPGSEAESAAMMEVVQEIGDVSGALAAMLADGVREPHERELVVREIDEAQAKLARLRAIVAGVPVRAVAIAEEAGRC